MEPRVSHSLLDALARYFGAKSDAALARALDVMPPDISRIRHRKRPITADFILRVHEITEWPIKDIKDKLR